MTYRRNGHGLTEDPWSPVCICGEKFANVTILDAHIRGTDATGNAPQHDISHSPSPQHRNTQNY